MHRIPRQLSLIVLALCSLALTACFSSDKPLIDAKSRVVPFKTPITIEVYERKDANDPWQKQRDLVTLVSDDQRVVRLTNEEVGDTYVFYPLESGRFLLEAHSKSNGRFMYGVLEIRDGEGLLHHMDCESIDQAAFEKAGGVVTGVYFKECKLDGVKDPLGFLKTLAEKPTGSQQRYVPVK